MRNWFRDLDRLLRGDATRMDTLREGTIDVDARGLFLLVVLLGNFYGACIGSFSLLGAQEGARWQILASTLKLPALFLLTLAITFPSLYVFNALLGSRLKLVEVLRLLLAALGVTLAVLASLGPIVVFFTVSTTSYPFMVLLNVVMCGVSGLLGLKFLLHTLNRLTTVLRTIESQAVFIEPEQNPAQPRSGPIERLENETFGPQVKYVFRCWLILFAVVGAQMGWVLRPFIGDPNRSFAWFRPRESNFFEAVLGAIRNVLW